MTPEMFLFQVSELIGELSFRRYLNPAFDSEVSSLNLIHGKDIRSDCGFSAARTK